MTSSRLALAAAAKHLDDADLLFEQGRADNAGYLSGYVVECCLKSLLLHPALPQEKELGHDLAHQIDRAWQFCLAIAPARRRMTLPTSVEVNTLLAQWKPDLRYDPVGNLATNTAAAFLTAAQQVFNAIAVEQQLDHSEYTKR